MFWPLSLPWMGVVHYQMKTFVDFVAHGKIWLVHGVSRGPSVWPTKRQNDNFRHPYHTCTKVENRKRKEEGEKRGKREEGREKRENFRNQVQTCETDFRSAMIWKCRKVPMFICFITTWALKWAQYNDHEALLFHILNELLIKCETIWHRLWKGARGLISWSYILTCNFKKRLCWGRYMKAICRVLGLILE